MSAVAALHFDPVFGMGSRQTYSSWPVVIESNQHSLFSPDLASNYASDTSVSPPSTSRSITGSPPHYSLSLTPQERELKHRQSQARRHEKIISRQSTSDSNIDSILTSGSTSPKHSSSIIGSPSFLHSSPTAVTEVTMADLGSSSATGSLPGIYTSSAPSQMPLMSAESVATTSAGLNSSSYYSPSMHDNASNQGVFSTPAYHGQQYMPEYTTASFPSAATSTLHSQYPRTAMPDQPNMVYPMHQPHSSIMGAGHMHQHHQQPPQHHQQAQQQASAHHSPLPLPMSQQHRPHHHSNGSGHQGQNSPPLSHTHAHAHSQTHPQAHSEAHPQAHAHAHPHAHSAPSHHHPHSYDGVVGSAVGAPGSAGVRVVQSRPKPQCWEHGCNGRQFSTFSNLLRHQREKSGQAAKAVCPNCGAEFTRTTARNGHLQHDKCKQRQRN